MSKAAYTHRPQSRDLQVGDRVEVIPYVGMEFDVGRRAGTVIYIHPALRYYTVRLDVGYTQSFQWGWER